MQNSYTCTCLHGYFNTLLMFCGLQRSQVALVEVNTSLLVS